MREVAAVHPDVDAIEAELALAAAKRAAREAAEQAAFVAWLAAQPDSFRAMAAEMFDLQTARGMPVGFRRSVSHDLKGRILYTIGCPNGLHQSYESFDHAVSLYMEAHRSAVEDLESTHLAIQAWQGGTLQQARDFARLAAKDAAAANPDKKGAELDAVVAAALTKAQAAAAQASAVVAPAPERT